MTWLGYYNVSCHSNMSSNYEREKRDSGTKAHEAMWLNVLTGYAVVGVWHRRRGASEGMYDRNSNLALQRWGHIGELYVQRDCNVMLCDVIQCYTDLIFRKCCHLLKCRKSHREIFMHPHAKTCLCKHTSKQHMKVRFLLKSRAWLQTA